MVKLTYLKKQSSQVCCVAQFVIPGKLAYCICGVTDALRFVTRTL